MLDRKDGLITVDDGVRRLRLLDAKGKVWTQEMLLQVEEKSVSLIDQETKVRLTWGVARTHTGERAASCLTPTTRLLAERAGELPRGVDPALPGRDERLQLRLHLGSGV